MNQNTIADELAAVRARIDAAIAFIDAFEVMPAAPADADCSATNKDAGKTSAATVKEIMISATVGAIMAEAIEAAKLYKRVNEMTVLDLRKRVVYLECFIHGMTGKPAVYPTPEGDELAAA